MCALPVSGQVSIIADDLTGAMDAAAPFASMGHSTYVSIDGTDAPSDARVVSINLATRRSERDQVLERVAAQSRTLDGLVMVKSDSTMRGRFGLEAQCAAESAGGDHVRFVVLCPAFPANRRTVSGGVLRIDGIPLDRTDVGRDKLTPIVSSSVQETVRHNTGAEVLEVPLRELRSRGLADALKASRDAAPLFVAPDAETDADLDRLVASAAQAAGRVLLCGSAGVASALARHLGRTPAPPARATGRTTPVLVITASHREVTAQQVGALERDRGFSRHRFDYSGDHAGPTLVQSLSDALGSGHDAAVTMALDGDAALNPGKYADDLVAVLRSAVENVSAGTRPAALFLVGGDTSEAVLAGIGARGIVLDSEPLPGVALGVIDGGAWDGVAVTTKSGAFGDRDTLVKLYDRVTGREAAE